jgi:hypothetical protein
MSEYSELSFSEDDQPTASDLEFVETDCTSDDTDYIPDSQTEQSEDYTEYPDSQ